MTEQYVLSKKRVVDASGNVLGGAKLNVFEAGTSTPLDTFSDTGLTTPNANPIVADSSGLFGNIFLAADDYKFILRDQNDIDEWTQDDYEVIASVTFGDGLELINGIVRVSSNVNNQTGVTYTVITGDRGATISFNNANPVAVTLPAADSSNFPDGWYAWFDNRGNGIVTITSTSSIDGDANITLNRNEGVRVTSDGTTYFTSRGQPKENYLRDGGELTISSGAVTIGEFSHYTIDTEADAATDDLDTISSPLDGKIVVIAAEDGARDVVVKHNTGNIFNPSTADMTLNDEFKNITLRFETALSKWIVTSTAGLNPPPTIQVFSASGTWTKPSGATTVKVTVVGGGGGAGLVGTTTSAAVAGGTSSFGAHATATGGAVGGMASAAADQAELGGIGGAGASGDVNADGGAGGYSVYLSPQVFSGAGGASILGGGAPSITQTNDGVDAVTQGSGGSGGAQATRASGAGGAGGASIKYVDVGAIASETVTVGAGGAGGIANVGNDGGDGADGVVIVEEYYG